MGRQTHSVFKRTGKSRILGPLLIFAWLGFCFFLYEALSAKGLARVFGFQIVCWPVFLSAAVFLLQETAPVKDRFFSTLIGGAVGLVLAAGVEKGTAMLTAAGLGHAKSVLLLTIAAFGLLILLHGALPYVFNNAGLCYFIAAALITKDAGSRLLPYLLSLAIGCITLNLGCSLLLSVFKGKRLDAQYNE